MKSLRIKPLKLQPGDKIATISFSWGSAGKFLFRYQTGIQQLQDSQSEFP